MKPPFVAKTNLKLIQTYLVIDSINKKVISQYSDKNYEVNAKYNRKSKII